MNDKPSNKAFTAERLFAQTYLPENMQAMAQRSVATSKELFAKSATVAQDGAKAMTEIADTAWGSTKMLHEKLVQNMRANAEATFVAAQAIATAKSLPEIAKLQSDFVQKFAAQANEQTKEFLDLSARATQHVIEKVHAVTRTMTPAA